MTDRTKIDEGYRALRQHRSEPPVPLNEAVSKLPEQIPEGMITRERMPISFAMMDGDAQEVEAQVKAARLRECARVCGNTRFKPDAVDWVTHTVEFLKEVATSKTIFVDDARVLLDGVVE